LNFVYCATVPDGEFDVDVDVLVVGSGAAGLSAALAAHEAGCTNVLIAEASGTVGGSSRLSGGVIMASGSEQQRQAGIVDDASAFFREYLQLNHWDVEPGAVRRFIEESGATIDWLVEHGVVFHEVLMFGGDAPVPRGHAAVGAGQGLVDALHAQCVERDIDVALGRRVDRLLTNAGTVVGAAVGSDELYARATVLTTGGFGANPEKLQSLFPSAWYDGWTWYVGSDGSQGDAIDLGAEVGAAVVGHDQGLRTLHARFRPRQQEAHLPGWMVLVDREGRRFVNEAAPYGVIDRLIGSRGNVAFAVFDDAAMRPPPALAAFYRHCYRESYPGRPAMRPRNWQAEVVDDAIVDGHAHAAPTIPALAAKLGVDPDVLTGTIDRYNDAVAAGHDADQLKPASFLAPVATPPFYAALVRPTVVELTAAGLRIDADGRVLHRTGRPIPGLYAAGECTGGIIGPVYVASGNSLGNCTTFGRIAGRAAAASVVSARRAREQT
jgi:fumarate reductase flavoprotein subunit